jgi:hypothetical protein
MERTLVIKDLAVADDQTTLTPEQMKRLRGGRSVLATVDGNHVGSIDDWQMNIAIFEGRVGGPYIV